MGRREGIVIRAASALATAAFLAFWMTLLASQGQAGESGTGSAVADRGAHGANAR